MKQKIVMKVSMNCDKCRTKAMKVASVAPGVNSMKIDGKDKDRLVVIGDGVDAVKLTSMLRKKVGYAAIESVEMVKESNDKDKDKDKDKKKDDKKDDQWRCVSSYTCPLEYPLPLHYCQVVYDHNPTPSCSIM